jgi:hypothetical protein
MKVLLTRVAGSSFGRAFALNLLRKFACAETGSPLSNDCASRGTL